MRLYWIMFRDATNHTDKTKMGVKMNRKTGIDILKVLATFFVIVLHVNGYAISAHGMDLASKSAKLIYLILESFSFCAVNLFVLCGGYLMTVKRTIRLSQIIRIWLSTLVVGIIGLGLAYIIGIRASVMGILKSILPISFRAYGFLTSYLILIAFSPFLNLALSMMSNAKVLYVSLLLGVILVLLPSFASNIGWHGNYTASFVFLYFVAAYIRRKEENMRIGITTRKAGGLIWLFSTSLLAASPYILEYAGKKLHAVKGHEMHFFDYSNILVMGQSIGLFVFIVGINEEIKVHKTMEILVGNSLFVYIFHMHPILKNQYTKWSLIQSIYSNNGLIYGVKVIIFALFVYVIGNVISIIVANVINCWTSIIVNKVQRHNKINSILTECRVDCR